jgi:hypothetical protein
MRAQYEHAVAILTGKPPANLTLPPAPITAQIPDIPGAVPSQLLERRPDIAAEERRMAAANEQIGIAKAAYYPPERHVGRRADTRANHFRRRPPPRDFANRFGKLRCRSRELPALNGA